MKKIILAAAVFAFTVFSVAWSYSRYGKKVSENTSGTVEGKILVSRKFAEINKVIAIDSQKKSHKKEVTGWNYDAATCELFVTEGLSDFTTPIFHIEGKPCEVAEFILWNLDLNKGPAAVFLNGKTAVQNREFVIDEKTKTLAIKIPPKEISSIAIVWHTADGGISSISEMTQKEADLYAELEGAWFTENAKKKIAAITENPVLEFKEGVENSSPRIVMKKLTDEERQKMLDEFPVNTYKIRRKANMKKLSREAGFKITLPQKCGEYKIVSTMLIESAVKGEKSKTVEFSYDKTDFFSLDSICIEVAKIAEGNDKKDEKIEYPISTEILELKIPVKKQTCWTISDTSEREGVGENSAAALYKAEVLCIYTWTQNDAVYKIQCLKDKALETESFLKELF